MIVATSFAEIVLHPLHDSVAAHRARQTELRGGFCMIVCMCFRCHREDSVVVVAIEFRIAGGLREGEADGGWHGAHSSL